MTVCGNTHAQHPLVVSFMTMAGEIRTRATLLMRIRNLGDADAWRQFLEIYQPVIQGYLRRRGLREADAADVAQETLSAVAKNIERFKYDPLKGHFRGWLLTIARRQLAQFVERAAKPAAVAGTGQTATHEMLDSLPADDDDARQWERDCEQQALQWAMNQIEREFQPQTWRAFYATAVEDAPPQRVAEELGVTVSAVYTARSRVTARLRQVIDELEGGS
jgi:RNA polymerase sigma-70 factor (ECF subfamily)